MANNFRIKFNPVKKEIEVEGSEKFVKEHFNRLQAIISGPAKKTVAAKKDRKYTKAVALKKKAKKTTKKPGKVTNIDKVVGLIQASAEGISTAELKKKTGLAESQIWNIVNRAKNEGKVRKAKRGLYAAV